MTKMTENESFQKQNDLCKPLEIHHIIGKYIDDTRNDDYQIPRNFRIMHEIDMIHQQKLAMVYF